MRWSSSAAIPPCWRSTAWQIQAPRKALSRSPAVDRVTGKLGEASVTNRRILDGPCGDGERGALAGGAHQQIEWLDEGDASEKGGAFERACRRRVEFRFQTLTKRVSVMRFRIKAGAGSAKARLAKQQC